MRHRLQILGTLAAAAISLATCGRETAAPPAATISVPQDLNVPYGQAASLPIQLPAPAPTGGVSLTVVSSAPGFVSVAASPVTVPAGAQTVNATLNGVLPGPATITVSNAAYVDGVTNATTTASLDITPKSPSLDASFGTSITIDFLSNSVPAAAPAPGITVSLASANPACLAATSPVTIATGLVSSTSALSYGGSAPLPCTTKLVAQAANILADSTDVRVDPVPQILVGGGTVASGLQTSKSFTLTAPNHGTITVTLTSANASVLLAPDQTTAGQQTIAIPVADGVQEVGFVVQGADTVTAPTTSLLTVSAPGFSNGTATMTAVQAGIQLVGLQSGVFVLSPPNAVYASIGLPSGSGLNPFNRRAGAGPLTVTFTTPADGVGALVKAGKPAGTTQTAQIAEGAYTTPVTLNSGGVAFQPLSTGTTTVSVSAPGVVAMPNATGAVTVTQPGITVRAVTVGSGLQNISTALLLAPNHGPITVTLVSANASVLLAPNATTAGQQTITIPVADQVQDVGFFVQGADTVTATTTSLVTVSAPGFTDGTATMTVMQAGIQLVGLPSSTTNLSLSSPVYAYIGLPSGNGVGNLNRRVGAGPLTVTFTTPAGGVGELLKAGTTAGTTQTAQIVEGAYSTPLDTNSGGVAFRPLSTGTTTVSVSAPGVVATPNATGTVVVSQPAITVSPVTVGSGLQAATSFRLGAPNHGAIAVTLTSANAAVLVSPNATTVGQQTITIPVADQVQNVDFYVQGADTVTAMTTSLVTVSASGFSNGTATMTAVQAGIRLIGLPDSTTTLSGSSPVYATVGLPSVSGLSPENRRAGAGPLTVTFTTPGTVGDLLKVGTPAGKTQTAQIVEGVYYTPLDTTSGGVAFHPLSTGTTTVSVSAPGVVAPPYATGTVVVRQPGITVNPATVGSGLQTSTTFKLGAPSHGAITVTLSSSNPAVLLAPDATTAGQQTITIPVADQIQSVGFYVQGADGITQATTVTVTVTASGFTDGTTTATVVQSGVRLVGVPATLATTDSAVNIYAFIGVPSGGGVDFQSRRAGGAALTVTFTTSNVSTASLVTTAQPSGASSQTAQIVPGVYQTPLTRATGGVGLQPVAAGMSMISVSIPGFTAISGTQSVTVY